MPLSPKSIIAVPDINVFVSGTTISQGYPSQVFDLWQNNYFQIATSEPILQKMREVYLYPPVKKITGMNEEQADEFLKNLRQSAIVVSGKTVVDVSSDPEDNSLFACAIEAKANYIVSGDKKHVLSVGYFKGIKTISPKDFVEEILINQLTDI